ncbi:TRAP-type C4-dicarboxylate transport system permease small subunit [Rhodovulum bhavnagarense]|uniref:TRAP transporter small permease protein n=1 Tax=Rhodovulum bhavnagarense TaxID=992286 RepID=A0A4V6NRJ8_9RHOB|nr:TRAP transporter small permease [Rhodovulum bhavnagarense]TCP60366.1 TRAP-type C4-dicarboxylate transport system permease small subunit [Rhodovulum bhavnagarense]
MSGSPHATLPAQHGGNPVLRVIGLLSRLSGIASALLIVASVGVTCQMIWVRFVLNQSTIWQTEGVTYMMIGATMLGLPYVQYLRGHVNVDLLPLMLPPAARKGLAALVLVLTLAVVSVMLWHGYHFWFEAWDWGETSNTPWNPKLWVPYLALPLGFGLYALQLAADTWAMLSEIEPPFGLDPGAGLVDDIAERAD